MSAAMSGPAFTSGGSRRRTAPRGRIGRAVALLAAGTQIVAVFLPWEPDVAALDLTLRGFEVGVGQPTVGTTLVVLAALAAIPALVSDIGWPRLASALGTGALVLAWIARGPEGTIEPGAAIALGAAVAHLLTAAVARGPVIPGPPPRPLARRDRPTIEDPVPGSTTDGPRGAGAGGGTADHGFRALDHTADTAFEAWGPTRAACFAEAVRALVDSFADTTDAEPRGEHRISLEPADDEDLLVGLLDEVIYLLDTRGAVPVGGRIRDRDDGGLTGYLDLADTGDVRPGGAVPKAITYHGLEVTGAPDGWRCRVTVDV